MRFDLPVKTSFIRPLDIRRDLTAVADLIEVCFANTLDSDGREYLRQIRRAAIDPAYVRWVAGASERVSTPLFGYVCEQDRRVIGNLSLIPVFRGGEWVYLIANVAVHPDYRRQGIGRDLTLRAIEHARAHHVTSTWLQVRDDNPSAYALYESTGFIERSRRTTWVNQFTPTLPYASQVTIGSRRGSDWELQRKWMEDIYPADATWNLFYDLTRFHPGLLRQAWHWLNGETQMHWAARRSGSRETLGFASWEPLRTTFDQVWICAPIESENDAVRALLPFIQQYLESRRRPININYPYLRAQKAFSECGFTRLNTLIWMEHQVLPP